MYGWIMEKKERDGLGNKPGFKKLLSYCVERRSMRLNIEYRVIIEDQKVDFLGTLTPSQLFCIFIKRQVNWNVNLSFLTNKVIFYTHIIHYTICFFLTFEEYFF